MAGYSLWECFTYILDCGLCFNFLKNIFEKQFFANEVQFIILSFLKNILFKKFGFSKVTKIFFISSQKFLVLPHNL